MAANPDQRNWKGIGIAFFVIAVILLCVFAAVVVLTPEDEGEGEGGRPFEVSHLGDARFKPRRFNGSWISGEFPFKK